MKPLPVTQSSDIESITDLLITEAMDLMFQAQLLSERLEVTCKQLVHIDSALHALKVRYQRAASHKQLLFSTPIYIKISTLESLQAALYQYVKQQTDLLDELEDCIEEHESIDV